MKKILFVCLGNICRSPMAEAIMRQNILKAGQNHFISVDSAGTSDWHSGEAPHKGTLLQLAAHQIPFDHIYARQIKLRDFDYFDFIIGMDQQNVENLIQLAPFQFQHKISLFLDAVPYVTEKNVPDPWYTGNFDETYQLIATGCQEILQKVIEKDCIL